jgi:hypothetical protein
MPSSEISPKETTDRVIALVESALKPLTYNQLKKKTRLRDAEMKGALDAGVKRGAVFRWPDYRRSQYFWSQSPNQVAQQAVLAVASEEAFSQAVLIEKAGKRVPGFSHDALRRIVMDLVGSHELQQVPAFTTGKLLVRPGNAAAYAAAARKFIAAKFRKAGLDPPPFLLQGSSQAGQATPTPSLNSAAQVLDAIRSLEPVTGVPVSAQRLRNHLPDLSKRNFDSAALELRNKEEVFLSLHHDPHSLSQQEQDLLIDGGDGSFYVAIAIRR